MLRSKSGRGTLTTAVVLKGEPPGTTVNIWIVASREGEDRERIVMVWSEPPLLLMLMQLLPTEDPLRHRQRWPAAATSHDCCPSLTKIVPLQSPATWISFFMSVGYFSVAGLSLQPKSLGPLH